jgi:hypothetical protein|tara:strand:- start:329 stop:736 length:408 start_codon:yes stop_codon:yes gene_type:complete
MLPSLSDQGVLQSIRAIDSSVEGKPLKTHPGIPMGGGVVAGEVLNFLDVIVLLEAHHHPVPHEGSYPAGMGVVWGTDISETPVISILVAINFFPIPIGIMCERIFYLLKKGKGKDLFGHEKQSRARRSRLQKFAS